jgi:hypothetical protein
LYPVLFSPIPAIKAKHYPSLHGGRQNNDERRRYVMALCRSPCQITPLIALAKIAVVI